MIDGILAFAAANEFIVLGILALLVIIVVVVMALSLARGGRAHMPVDEKADLDLLALPTGASEAAEKRSDVAATARGLRRIMQDGLSVYREVYVRNPYLMPWVLRIGGEDDGGLLAAQENIHAPIGGSSHDGATWNFFHRGVIIDVANEAAMAGTLRFVSRRRAALPLDGVIVTIPASALADVRTANAKGTEIYSQLWKIQRQLGFAVPVYVVISGNEEMEGFNAFTEMLPEGLRNGMLGWSFPYPMESAFSPDYVSEALHALHQAMLATTLEAFGSVVDADLGARLTRVRDELAAYEQPLRALMETAFRRTAYQESLYFRGLYFIARPHPGAPAAFARDLVDDKIFVEAGLSKPLRANRRSRQALRYTWLAAAGLIAIASIWISMARLESYRALVVPVLRATSTDIAAVSAPQGGAVLSSDAEADAAIRYLRNVTALDKSEPLVMVPMAWFDSDPYQVRAAMQAGWQRIVLPAMKRRIEDKLQASAAAPADGVPPDEAFVTFMGRSSEADGAVEAFDDLTRNDRRVSVPALLDFAFGVKVPPSVVGKLTAWKAIGPDAPPVDDAHLHIDPAAYQDSQLAAFQHFADAYFLQLSQGGQLGARLGSVAREIGLLSSGAHSGEAAVSGFNEVWSGLNDVSSQLASARPTWISAPGPDIPADVDRIIADASKTALLGPRARQIATDLARRRFNEIKDKVATVYSVIGPLVTRRADGVASLSPAADTLRQVLGQWLTRPFMTPPPAAAPGQKEGSGANWDSAALDAVPPLFDDYLLFQTKQLPQVPNPLGPAVRAAAQFRLGQIVGGDLDRALPTFDMGNVSGDGRLSALRNWSRALRAAFPVLEQAMQTFTQIGMPQSADAVQRRVNNIASGVLQQVDDLIRQDQLYVPNRFYLANWTAGPLMPPQLFGQHDAAGLAQLLASSRAEVSVMARDIAGPVLDLLSRPVMQNSDASASAARWNAVVAALDQYDASRPNSSLKLLEQFITQDSAKIDDRNCGLLDASWAGDSDFFLQRLDAIKAAIRDRCGNLGDDKLFAGYGQIEAFFNDRLAGHTPFARSAGGPAAEASASDIHDFYTLFDAHKDDVVKGLASMGSARPDIREMARFVASMAAAEPLLLQVASPVLGTNLQIAPEFRVNRDREAGGADIIEWQLHAADRTVSSFTPGTLTWSPGDRVALALRWAKDAPIAPAAPIASTIGAVSRVDGPTAWFEQGGMWSLLTFLRDHNAVTLTGAGSARPVERFEVPTAPRNSGPNTDLTAKPGVARLFVALQLKRSGNVDGKPVNEPLPYTDLPVMAPHSPVRARSFVPVGAVNPATLLPATLLPTESDRSVFGLDRVPAGSLPEPLKVLPPGETPDAR